MEKQLEKIYTHCNDCQKMTNHIVLFRKRLTTYDDSYRENSPHHESHTDYMIIQCNGCDETSFVIRSIGGMFADEDSQIGHFDENFPNGEYDFYVVLLSEEEQSTLPKTLKKLYKEVEGAFKKEANILAGVGLRMLVESICLERKIQGKNLKEKIKNLNSAGLISANEIPILDKLRLLGNFSAHEIKGFSNEMLEYALGIINHILKSIYVLPKINKKLKI
jgi:Domain of unknown function (DUF4145)